MQLRVSVTNVNEHGRTHRILEFVLFFYKYGAHGVKRALEIMHTAHLVEENQNRMKRNNNKNGKIDWIFFLFKCFFFHLRLSLPFTVSSLECSNLNKFCCLR